MASVLNLMAAQRYRLKVGFWPLFLNGAAVIIAAVGAWIQLVSWQSGGDSYGGVDALLPQARTAGLVLGTMTCYALLRDAVTLSDSNYLRSKRDRAAHAASLALMSLAITAVTVCLSALTELATRVILGLPFLMLEPFTVLALICQVTLVTWSVCLAGLCVGHASRSSGASAVVIVLAMFAVPGSVFALPFTANGLETVGVWFSENQPCTWLGLLSRGELLGADVVALLAVSCAVLVLILSVISMRRKLK